MSDFGTLREKHDALLERLRAWERVGVAFSAGVDSTLLLAVAHEALGEHALAFTAVSPANPARETDEASRFCAERGIRQITFHVNELEIKGFERNPENRCYLGKTHLFGEIVRLAQAEGLNKLVEGSNVDDLSDYRPGYSALAELGIESPFVDCGFTKQDIRDLSHKLGLPTWDKPSFACLYTRFGYGDLITPEKLRRIDESEQFLIECGFRTVRVRVLGDAADTARIELAADDIARIAAPDLRQHVVQKLKSLGFTYVSVDLEGYRTGSMNAHIA